MALVDTLCMPIIFASQLPSFSNFNYKLFFNLGSSPECKLEVAILST